MTLIIAWLGLGSAIDGLLWFSFKWIILGELAYHGHRVKIWDVNNQALNTVFNVLEDDKKQLREDGLFQKNFVVSRIKKIKPSIEQGNIFQTFPVTFFKIPLIIGTLGWA